MATKPGEVPSRESRLRLTVSSFVGDVQSFVGRVGAVHDSQLPPTVIGHAILGDVLLVGGVSFLYRGALQGLLGEWQEVSIKLHAAEDASQAFHPRLHDRSLIVLQTSATEQAQQK